MTKEEQTLYRLQQQLATLGPVMPGSLSEQWNVCGTSGCRCKAPSNPKKHGPYYQRSFTVAGRAPRSLSRRGIWARCGGDSSAISASRRLPLTGYTPASPWLASRASESCHNEGDPAAAGGVKKNRITRLAKQTGFQQRSGWLTPYDFLVLLTLGQLGLPQPSLGGDGGGNLLAHQSRSLTSTLYGFGGCLSPSLSTHRASPQVAAGADSHQTPPALCPGPTGG